MNFITNPSCEDTQSGCGDGYSHCYHNTIQMKNEEKSEKPGDEKYTSM